MPMMPSYLRYFGGAPAATPQPRSRIMELLEALESQQQAEPAAPLQFRDLPLDERRRINGQGIANLGALIGGADMGHMGSALAEGAGQFGDLRQRAVQEQATALARQRAERQSSISQQLQIERARQEERSRVSDEEIKGRERERLGALADAIRQQLEPGDTRSEEAGALAASGDQAGLVKLAGGLREERQRRRLAQELGVDPDDDAALETAQRIRQEEALKKRGLGSYFRQPQQPHEGSIQVGDDGFYHVIDQISGRSTPTDVRAPQKDGTHISLEEENRAADFNHAVTLAGQKRRQQNIAYQAMLRDPSSWPWDGEHQVPPSPPVDNFQEMVQNHFTVLQRARAASKPARMVSPVGGPEPHGAPTSATGPGKGKPQDGKATANDVIRLLPKGMVLDPGARANIEQDLRAGKTPAQIRTEILRDNGLL